MAGIYFKFKNINQNNCGGINISPKINSKNKDDSMNDNKSEKENKENKENKEKREELSKIYTNSPSLIIDVQKNKNNNLESSKKR